MAHIQPNPIPFGDRAAQFIPLDGVQNIVYYSLLNQQPPNYLSFLPFRASASSFFWLFSLPIFLFSLTLSISAFHLSILSEVWLLNFLRWIRMLPINIHCNIVIPVYYPVISSSIHGNLPLLSHYYIPCTVNPGLINHGFIIRGVLLQ